MPELTTYRVGLPTSDWDTATKIKAHQIEIDDHGTLSFFTFKEREGFSLPQLTTTAAFPRGAWTSVVETSDV